MKQKALIGIDPDCSKNGFALYLPKERQITELKVYDFTDLMAELKRHSETYELTVNLEAGWLIPGTWHKGGAGQAKRVGANHEIGRQIEKFLIKEGITYKLIKPQGYSSYDHEKFCKITGWPLKVKTNAEKRVAGMMVFGY